ncbi:hypothetical protein DFH07DRAFT_773284 [Mycena maculata]|uniref:Uncharacterized protein n=1 Tax=Mycena maculata TaxID=230809 RepID=A0AAD7J3C6_9AGAR|nr:hypothetical protein DFH07DRAFT_773284 [Mycena maculata]
MGSRSTAMLARGSYSGLIKTTRDAGTVRITNTGFQELSGCTKQAKLHLRPWASAHRRATPLLSQHVPATRKTNFPGPLVVTLLLIFTGWGTISEWRSREDALDPPTRDRMRRELDEEIRGHEKIREAFNRELVEHDMIRVGWEDECQEMREAFGREVAEQQRVRLGWENECQEMREAFGREVAEQQREGDGGARSSPRGVGDERQEIIAMRDQLERDRSKWAQDRADEKREDARRKKEEEDRVRAGFSWDGLKADDRCLRRGARQYTAQIFNVPREYDPVQACAETSVEIHGQRIRSPDHCEDRGCSGVFGHWTIDFSEPTCVTYFDNFKDQGCTSPGSGLRRIESHLENLQANDDWRAMCSTTPADFRRLHFDSPEMCENWVRFLSLA